MQVPDNQVQLGLSDSGNSNLLIDPVLAFIKAYRPKGSLSWIAHRFQKVIELKFNLRDKLINTHPTFLKRFRDSQ